MRGKSARPTSSISAMRALVELRRARGLRAPEVERAAALALQRDAHVLQHGEMREHRGNLERAHQAEPRDVGRRAAPVMSRPLKKMRPRVGGRNLVSRLKQVVLPAPFGPIRAWMVPRSTRRLTPLTATKPANSLVRSSVSRMMSLIRGSPLSRLSRAARAGASIPLLAGGGQKQTRPDGGVRAGR